jgi:iron(III) transport system ATP-binding protein
MSSDTLTSTAAVKSVPNMPQVSVRNLVKRYKTKRGEVVALDNVSIEIAKSERVVLLGPSGCGKTTLLRCVAGLEEPDSGEIEINGVTVFSASRGIFIPPEARGISMMFQSYALWPHMTVAENIAYPLENRAGSNRKADIQRVNTALAMVACDGLQSRYPAQLSGGQQQRIALARAVIANDGIVLFDEPLSNVDAKVREQLRLELITLQRKLGFAWLYVTHDQTDATAVADRIAVFRSGQIAQLGSPSEIYNCPSSRYVAEFMGSSNTLTGTVEGFNAGLTAIQSEIGLLHLRSTEHARVGDRVTVVFRPEQLEIKKYTEDIEHVNSYPAQLEASMFLGN